jgi:nitric oxide reductase NorQ protein
MLPIDKRGELLHAHGDFQLVVSYNPAYRSGLKELKPSTRQRFVALEFDYPPAAIEAEVVRREAGIAEALAVQLVQLGQYVRRLREQALASEVASTRALVQAGRLIAAGIDPARACEAAIAQALSDEPDVVSAIARLVRAVFA